MEMYAYADRLCDWCDKPLTPPQTRWCCHTCGKAGWNRAVMNDPTLKARRYTMLTAARHRRSDAHRIAGWLT